MEDSELREQTDTASSDTAPDERLYTPLLETSLDKPAALSLRRLSAAAMLQARFGIMMKKRVVSRSRLRTIRRGRMAATESTTLRML